MIAIIDYDIGNISAITNMLQRLGTMCVVTSDPADIDKAEKIILPGNGAFDACIKNLRKSGVLPCLEQKVLKDKTPLLGICVGAQMLGNCSEEGCEHGLGWLNMDAKRFPDSMGLPVPHMGWNQIEVSNTEHSITASTSPDTRFYFTHSYYMEPKDDADILMKARYGIEFTAAVTKENITGVQFHPEKSHRFGKRLLDAFTKAG